MKTWAPFFLVELHENRGVPEPTNPLCATRHAQAFHPASLSRECGVSQPTTRAWGNVLEAGFTVIMLPPFFKNYGKRLIKSPKLYFSDPALVAYLTRQPAAEAALKGSVENVL